MGEFYVPDKVTKEDLVEIKLYSALLDSCTERMNSLGWQEKNLETTKALIAERKKLVQLDAQEAAKKLDELGQMLEEKYGVEDEKQVNWETGEIKPPQSTTEQGKEIGASSDRLPDSTGQV